MNIEERIQELRKKKGISQEQMADILGVSRQAVSKWEGGQSLPEIEKLLAMSELFGVSIDYILKGGPLPGPGKKRGDKRLGSLIVAAVATMLLAMAIFGTFGQVSDNTGTMTLYAGLMVECVGIMLMLVSWFLAGGRLYSKPLFVVNVLLAGILPALFITQVVIFGYGPNPPLTVTPVSAVVYMVICGAVIFLALRRADSRERGDI